MRCAICGIEIDSIDEEDRKENWVMGIIVRQWLR
jgi:hypothetical protein